MPVKIFVSVRLVRGKEEAGRPIVVLSHLTHCRLFHMCRFLSDFCRRLFATVIVCDGKEACVRVGKVRQANTCKGAPCGRAHKLSKGSILDRG